MTDFPLELTKSNQKGSSWLDREVELFSNAPAEIWEGMKNRGQQMLDNKALTGLEIVGSVAIGGAIALGSKNPGALGAIARNAPKVIGLVAGADIVSRVALPMYEAGRQGGSVDLAQKQLGANLGSALIDYPLMAAGGFAGSKLAPRAASLLAPERFPIGSPAPKFAVEPGPAGPAGSSKDLLLSQFRPDGYKWVPPRGLGERAPDFNIPPGSSARINPELLNMRNFDISKMISVKTVEIPPPAVSAAMGVATMQGLLNPTPYDKPEFGILQKIPYLKDNSWLKKIDLHEIHGESIRRMDNFELHLKTAPKWLEEQSKELKEKK